MAIRSFIFVLGINCMLNVSLTAQQLQTQPAPQRQQQPLPQQPLRQQVAQQQPGAPAWFPLPPEHEKYLDDVLKYWEHTADQVERYRCKFMRWEYDRTRFPRHPEVAATVSQGDIQFAAPDKGLFRVEKVWRVAVQQVKSPDNTTTVTLPVMKDNKPQYQVENNVAGEHWVCDGKSIFQFDAANKQLIKRELPPELQGKRIVDGPLPFLFGAKAQDIKARYWIRVISPPPEPGRFHLEAIPKRREEAADFSAINVVIDEEHFLPEGLILWDRAGGKTSYKFTDRESNWSMLPEKLNPFHQQFYAPKLPAGWTQVNERYDPAPTAGPAPAGSSPAGPPAGNPGAMRQTQLPAGPPRR